MKMLNRKTRKAIRKSVGKAFKKHGPQILAGLAGGISSTLATLASADADTNGQSRLTNLSKKVSTLWAGENGRKSERQHESTFGTGKKKGKSSTKRGDRVAHSEPSV